MRILPALIAVPAAAAALALPTAAAAAPSKPPKVDEVTISCVGDTVRGAIVSRGPHGTVAVVLESSANGSTWAATGRATTVTITTSQREHPYQLSASGLQGVWFRTTVNGVSSRAVSAQTCAPPAQVPEAPFALALPASLLATLAAVGLVRRRRGAVAAARS